MLHQFARLIYLTIHNFSKLIPLFELIATGTRSFFSNTRKRTSYYRPWGSLENGQIEFESLSDETLEGALDVIRKAFFPYESVSVGVELISEPGASEELEELCLLAAKDGVSVVAIDITTNEVVGVAFNKLQVSNYFLQYNILYRGKRFF